MRPLQPPDEPTIVLAIKLGSVRTRAGGREWAALSAVQRHHFRRLKIAACGLAVGFATEEGFDGMLEQLAHAHALGGALAPIRFGFALALALLCGAVHVAACGAPDRRPGPEDDRAAADGPGLPDGRDGCASSVNATLLGGASDPLAGTRGSA